MYRDGLSLNENLKNFEGSLNQHNIKMSVVPFHLLYLGLHQKTSSLQVLSEQTET